MKKFFFAIAAAFMLVAQFSVASAYDLSYQAYVEKIGWMRTVGEGQTAGTTGEGLRMEAIRINLSGIEYQTHIEGIGWQRWVSDGDVSGTTNRSLRMEAIRIHLTGSYANSYDVRYRVHVEGRGWTNWVSNGEIAGTTGQSRRIEAIQIALANKSSSRSRYDDDYNSSRRSRYDDDDDYYDRGSRRHRYNW